MASRVRRNLESTASSMQLPALNDDLLEEIFLRIACPADLARASAACASFRRLIADPTFLRRYRSCHPPLLLGFFNLDVAKGFHAVEAPHPNAPAARAMANVSFDFLPPPGLENWFVSDICDGRVLFGCSELIDGNAFVTGLAVWFPSSLSRRYLLLPPILDDDQIGEQDIKYFDAVFAPSSAQEKDDETLFRVIGILYYETKLVVLVFDSTSDNWTVRTSGCFDALIECPSAFLLPPAYAYGCLHWKVDAQNKLLKLDINRMDFSTVELPLGHNALAVCDLSSLSRRYLLLPPVPRDQDRLKYFVAAFAPCAHDDDETLFRVIGMMYYDTKLVVLVFDSASGSWTIGTSASWDVLSSIIELKGRYPWMSLIFLGYAYGCFYWKGDKLNKLLKLDIQRMEFSTVDLPPGHEKHVVFVVEAGEGRLVMFSYNPKNRKFLNCDNSMQDEDQRTNEWQMRNVIPLPINHNLGIYVALQGHVLVQGDSEGHDSKHTTIYSLEIMTLKFEMVTQMSCHFEGRPYFGFPPCISPRRI